MGRVTWIDAWVDSDAESARETLHDQGKLTVDIGGYIKKTKNCVLLAANYDPTDGFVRFITRIPMSLVQEIAISTSEEVAFTRRKPENGKNESQKP